MELYIMRCWATANCMSTEKRAPLSPHRQKFHPPRRLFCMLGLAIRRGRFCTFVDVLAVCRLAERLNGRVIRDLQQEITILLWLSLPLICAKADIRELVNVMDIHKKGP